MNQEERSGLELSSLSFQKMAYMNGERAEPSSTTTNVPIRISTSTIGIIQYFFRAFKNRRYSATMEDCFTVGPLDPAASA